MRPSWAGAIVAFASCLLLQPGSADDFFVDSQHRARTFTVIENIEASRPLLRYQNGPTLRLVGRLGVGFVEGVDDAARRSLLEDVGARTEKRYELAPDFVIAQVQEGVDVLAASRRLMASSLVRFAEPIARIPMELHRAPDDPVFLADVQLHLRQDMHDFVSAWDMTVGDPRVVVAVLDTGVDATHSELFANLHASLDVLDPMGSGAPELGFEDDYHGTAVAGLIAAATDNGKGIAGMCWDCSLVSVRLIDSAATLYSDQEAIFDAFDGALQQGAWIINNSWGPSGKDDKGHCVATPFGDIVAEAVDMAETSGRDGRGTLVVWSAGNDGCPTSLQPHLAVEESVVVSALDGLRGLQPYSNRGYEVDVCAVEGNFTTDITGKAGASDGSDEFLRKFEGLEAADYLRNFRGTSAAAPVASGALALILSAAPNLSAQQARECLYSSATAVESACEDGPVSEGRSPCFGLGSFDVAVAVEKAHSGECGGLCKSDDDCIQGTICGKGGHCEFGQRQGDGDGSDSVESQDTDENELEGEEEQEEGRAAGCGCSLIGA
ncbi:MAG: S8 family serine peptidase [Myxococcota bacterium]|nr:S8 family serine peptidase [Myxococcota bacterium]